MPIHFKWPHRVCVFLLSHFPFPSFTFPFIVINFYRALVCRVLHSLPYPIPVVSQTDEQNDLPQDRLLTAVARAFWYSAIFILCYRSQARALASRVYNNHVTHLRNQSKSCVDGSHVSNYWLLIKRAGCNNDGAVAMPRPVLRGAVEPSCTLFHVLCR